MKRYLFIILLLFGVSTAVSYGQTHYRVTDNNVNVRTGPELILNLLRVSYMSSPDLAYREVRRSL